MKLSKYDKWPILHYGETEPLTICKMAKRQGESEYHIRLLRERFIDIHKIIKDCWVLPVSSYSLKAVAHWLGFKWNIENSDGAKALLWWRQYQGSIKRKSIDRKTMQRIINYNLDDCLATLKITKWLLKN